MGIGGDLKHIWGNLDVKSPIYKCNDQHMAVVNAHAQLSSLWD